MQDWPKDFFDMLESVAYEIEQFFNGVVEIADSLAEQLQTTMGEELDECLQELFEPLADIYSEFEEVMGETDTSFTYTVEPTPEKHPACVGCHHYHGQVYGGNLLVCGMHPYGWEEGNCPDWQSGFPNSDDYNSFWDLSHSA